MFVSAVIVAAGSGTRLKTPTAKQFLDVCGKPILAYTLEVFEAESIVDEIIIVTSEGFIDYVKTDIVDKYGFKKVSGLVTGGSERQDSVWNGLKVVSQNADIILIHDGVRPFITGLKIQAVVADAAVFGACTLGVMPKDTIKQHDSNGLVTSTIDRRLLASIQTPQGFHRHIIIESYKKAITDGFIGTDDATLAERAGFSVKITEGSYNNIKITTPEDLTFSEVMIKIRQGV